MQGDQPGFSFEAEGWTTPSISGALSCSNTPERERASRSDTFPTQISEEWRAGVGGVKIRVLSEDRNVLLSVVRDVSFEVSTE